MKKLLIFLVLLISITNSFAQSNAEADSKAKLLVYYFHLTHRCNTCQTIEATTKKNLETNFAKELKEGIIVYQSFNCELPENKKLVEKYTAYGSTLALTPIVNGKEAGMEDITNFAFSKIRNEEAYSQGLIEKINNYIK